MSMAIIYDKQTYKTKLRDLPNESQHEQISEFRIILKACLIESSNI
jgi:hypothetical protein